MNSIIYVGMDVHKESYTLRCYDIEKDELLYVLSALKPRYVLDYHLQSFEGLFPGYVFCA